MGSGIIRFDGYFATSSGASAIAVSCASAISVAIEQERPEIVVLPFLLANGTALDVLRALRARGHRVAVVVSRGVAGRWNEDALFESFANGAAGWASATEEVEAVVEAAFSGERRIEGSFCDEARRRALEARTPSPDPIELSRVRREVFHYVGCGLEAKEIAALRNRSHRTVQLHYRDICHQLAYPDHDTLRKQAVRWGHLRPNLT